MPHFLYRGASTTVTTASKKSVILTKNSAVSLPNDSAWVERQIALGNLTELPKAETKTKPVAKADQSKADKGASK